MTSKWPIAKVGDISEIVTRGISPAYDELGKVQVINQRCIRGGRVLGEFARRHDPAKKAVPENKFIKKDDILINSTGVGTVGRSALVSDEVKFGEQTVDSHVTIVRSMKSKVDPRFLHMAFVAFEPLIVSKAQGSGGQVELSRLEISNLEIPLPPLDEQKRIVAKLQEVLSAIEERRKLARSKLEEISSLSLHLLRNSFEGKAKVDELWKLTKLDDLFEFVNGRGFKTSEWKDAGLPIIRIQNLNNPLASFNHFDGGYDEKILVKNGDLLYAWSGTVGSSFGAHVWQGTDGLLNQHIFKVNPKVEIDSRYARFALDSITADIELQVNGSVGLRHITKSKLLNFEIPFPPLDEQIKFVSRMDELESEVAELKETSTKLLLQMDKLQATLLASAFVGEF